MRLSGTVTASKTLKKTFKNLRLADDLLTDKLILAANQIKNNAARNIQQVSIGEKIIRYSPPKGKRKITVSKPGDPPNTDTGTAIKSLRRLIDRKKFTVNVGTQLGYLATLEFSSSTNNRAARPWLRPAFNKFLKDKGSKFFIFKFPKSGKSR